MGLSACGPYIATPAAQQLTNLQFAICNLHFAIATSAAKTEHRRENRNLKDQTLAEAVPRSQPHATRW